MEIISKLFQRRIFCSTFSGESKAWFCTSSLKLCSKAKKEINKNRTAGDEKMPIKVLNVAEKNDAAKPLPNCYHEGSLFEKKGFLYTIKFINSPMKYNGSSATCS